MEPTLPLSSYSFLPDTDNTTSNLVTFSSDISESQPEVSRVGRVQPLSLIRTSENNAPHLIYTPLILDIIGVCAELSRGNKNAVLLSHYVQISLSVPGVAFAVLALIVCCQGCKSLRASLRIQSAFLALYDAVYQVLATAVSVSAALGVMTGPSINVLRIVQQVSGWGAAYTVLDITVERCLAICWPLRAHVIFTSAFAWKRAVVVFVTGICFSVPRVLDEIFDYSLSMSCQEQQPLTTFGIVYRLYITALLLYLLPFFAVAVANAVLACKLCRYRQNSAAAQTTTDNSGRELSRLVLMISVWYVVCMFAPSVFFLVRLTDVKVLDADILLRVALVADTSIVLNASLNFLFYFLFWGHFRRLFIEKACRGSCPAVLLRSSGSFSPPTVS
ncbi:hypothetical protein BaRGS_00007519 [Batillaria attramentaria]|uniref:G-protein coupled receptors family 1 profile domain-containing protein n=1 Tax=Batillaria attramentaria TaxID=370345 RepID=A0ABD0LP03_9CAEN